MGELVWCSRESLIEAFSHSRQTLTSIFGKCCTGWLGWPGYNGLCNNDLNIFQSLVFRDDSHDLFSCSERISHSALMKIWNLDEMAIMDTM